MRIQDNTQMRKMNGGGSWLKLMRSTIMNTQVAYPLYDQLAQIPIDGVIDLKMLASTINNIRNLSNEQQLEHYNEMFALIYHHSQLQGSHDQLPYEAKLINGGRGLIFTIEKMPTEVVHILANYLKIYSE